MTRTQGTPDLLGAWVSQIPLVQVGAGVPAPVAKKILGDLEARGGITHQDLFGVSEGISLSSSLCV